MRPEKESGKEKVISKRGTMGIRLLYVTSTCLHGLLKPDLYTTPTRGWSAAVQAYLSGMMAHG